MSFRTKPSNSLSIRSSSFKIVTAVAVSRRANASKDFLNKPLAISVASRNSDEGRALNPPCAIMDLTMRAILAASSPALSKLAVAFEMAMSRRKSFAVGCLLAMIVESSRSISTSKVLTLCSFSITTSATFSTNKESA